MKPLKFWQKTLLIAVESVMVLAVLVLLGGAVLVWRLNQGPIEVAFARKFIETALSDPVNQLSVDVAEIFLSWSEIDSRPQITMNNARVVNTRTRQTVFAVKSAGVSLSRSALLLGKALPRTIMIENPLLTVVRGRDGKFSLAMEQRPAGEGEAQAVDQAEAQSQSDFIFGLLDSLTRPRRELPRDWPARSLQMIVVDGARLMVTDHLLQRSWLVPRADLAFRRGGGTLVTTGALWLDDTQKGGKATINLEAAYLGESRNIVVDMEVNRLGSAFLSARMPDLDWLRGQDVALNGRAQATLAAGMELRRFDATLESADGQIHIPDLYDAPVSYRKMVMNVAYDARDGIVALHDSVLTLAEGVSMTVGAKIIPVKHEDPVAGYTVPMQIVVHSLPQDKVAAFWPAVLKGESAEDWALHRLSGGRVFDSTIDFTLGAVRRDENWSVTLDDLRTEFQIENMDVDYSAPLMPVKGADGKGVYDYKSDVMTIDVASGFLGDLAIESGKIVIDTVTGDAVGQATIDAHLRGPVKTVFKYIQSEPIGVATDAVSDVNKIEGTADLKVQVSFPTLADLPAEKIVVAAEGTADNVLLPGLVNGLDVSGGPVKVTVKDARIDASGKGRIDGRDMNFTYAQHFESKGKPFGMQVKADLMVDTGLRARFGIDLSDWMEGAVPAQIVYTDFGDDRAEVDVKIDATPATLMVKPMAYAKPPGIAASGSARVYMHKNILTRVAELRVETPDGKLDGAEMVFVQAGKETVLASGTMPRARLYETDVAIKFDVSPDNIVSMSIQGPFLDARPFLENDKKGGDYDGPGLRANVSVARMRTAEARLVEKARVHIDMDNQGELNRLEMDAVAGRGAVSFRYTPDQSGARMLLRITAEDAGAALQAFGVYENTRGGSFLVEGASAPGGDKRLISGRAEMVNFRVINAPVLARLVNALSLPGLLSLLGSDGIDFTRLESGFTWEKKKGVDMIRISEGRTSGASVGLTFQGTLDRMDDTVDVGGTLVPASMLNSILSNIPIIGDILTAGSGDAVFAATYTIRGPAKNPTTMVNPLAVLAPGFLRQIFFE